MIQGAVRSAGDCRAVPRVYTPPPSRRRSCRRRRLVPSGARQWIGWRSARSRRTATLSTTIHVLRVLLRAGDAGNGARRMPIGSRPARRVKDGGVDRCGCARSRGSSRGRKTRLLLPSWLGSGEAIGEALGRGERDQLREMYPRLGVLQVHARSDRNRPGRNGHPYRCVITIGSCTGGPAAARSRTARPARAAIRTVSTQPNRELLEENPVSALHRGPQPVRLSDQPRPDRAAAPTPRRRGDEPQISPGIHEDRERYCCGHEKHRLEGRGERKCSPQREQANKAPGV